MKDLKNTLVGTLLTVSIVSCGWAFNTHSRLAVLEKDSDRYGRVLEKNTEALQDLKLVIELVLEKVK